MCYSPITIFNPTKYISLKYRDRYGLQVPCGKCAQCQTNKQNEYYLRSYYQAQKCLSSGGFVLFDTLTYSPKYRPHILDFFPTKYNFPCFNSNHTRLFVVRLRQRIKRKYNSNFEFFLSSEYGSSDNHLHLPHYHILFFVTGPITPLQFSSEIAKAWLFGRTDGLPYKNDLYVLRNVLDSTNLARTIRVLKYVTKYIAKSCSFQREIDKRVNLIMWDVAKLYDDPQKWLETLPARLFREKLMRHIGQFHRQSTGYGASLLSEIDLDSLFKSGRVNVVDNKKVLLSVPLSTYYKRKLFYKQVEVDGNLIWTPTELGMEYLKCRESNNIKDLALQFDAAKAYLPGEYFDSGELSEYVFLYRGRIKSDLPSSTLEQRLDNISLYNYVTRFDKHDLSCCGLTFSFLGNRKLGYSVLKMPAHIKPFQFMKQYCYYDEKKEEILDKIYFIKSKIDDKKQAAYELKQYLTNFYKHIFV